MTETFAENVQAEASHGERACAYRILRYTPNLVRDEWVNIGVLVFDPRTGERRLRLIEDEEEFGRVRRLHPRADEALLRALRDDLEDRFQSAALQNNGGDWQHLLAKWDDTLSNALQLAPQKGTLTGDLDAELERLYADHIGVQRAGVRVGTPGSRAQIRSYCSQVLRQARLWERIEKSVRASEFTFPGDPMRLDYSYRRNGTQGFVQTLSVTRSPADAKLLAYTAQHITAKARLKTEFAAVTDVELREENERHRFVRDTLRDAGIEPIAMEGFAVWVAKLKPLMQ
ncbi:MAG TPA: DUF3037 domain-containing protein [Candidatus Acidoferrum sp.]|nr:DUF3037 domain-containing protein [Candidatus Acidoferrum sp.]